MSKLLDYIVIYVKSIMQDLQFAQSTVIKHSSRLQRAMSIDRATSLTSSMHNRAWHVLQCCMCCVLFTQLFLDKAWQHCIAAVRPSRQFGVQNPNLTNVWEGTVCAILHKFRVFRAKKSLQQHQSHSDPRMPENAKKLLWMSRDVSALLYVITVMQLECCTANAVWQQKGGRS